MTYLPDIPTDRRCMLCRRDWAIHDDGRHPFTPRGQGSEFDPSPMYVARPVPVPKGSVPEETPPEHLRGEDFGDALGDIDHDE